MNKQDALKLKELVPKVLEVNPSWREGQTFFNLLFQRHPSEANRIRGTAMDMFYDDYNIDQFIYSLNDGDGEETTI